MALHTNASTDGRAGGGREVNHHRSTLRRRGETRLALGLGCLLGVLGLVLLQPGEPRALHLDSQPLTPAEAAAYFTGRSAGAAVARLDDWPPAFDS